MEPSQFPRELDDRFFRRLLTKAHYELWQSGASGRADPLDVAEEVIIELYRKWAAGELQTTEPESLLRGLAAIMIRRRAADAGRRARVRRERRAPHSDPDLVGSAAALDRLPAVITETSTRLRRFDARDRTHAILDFLARREQADERAHGDYELFILHRVEELTFEEIAARRGPGHTAEGLRSRLRRVEKLIREIGATPTPLRKWRSGREAGPGLSGR